MPVHVVPSCVTRFKKVCNGERSCHSVPASSHRFTLEMIIHTQLTEGILWRVAVDELGLHAARQDIYNELGDESESREMLSFL